MPIMFSHENEIEVISFLGFVNRIICSNENNDQVRQPMQLQCQQLIFDVNQQDHTHHDFCSIVLQGLQLMNEHYANFPTKQRWIELHIDLLDHRNGTHTDHTHREALRSIYDSYSTHEVFLQCYMLTKQTFKLRLEFL